MHGKTASKKTRSHVERVWTAEEAEKIIDRKNPNNLLLRSAKLEAKGDFDGAIEAIERAIEKNPNGTAMQSYLDDLLRRRRIHEAHSPTENSAQKELAPTAT